MGSGRSECMLDLRSQRQVRNDNVRRDAVAGAGKARCVGSHCTYLGSVESSGSVAPSPQFSRRVRFIQTQNRIIAPSYR